MLSQNLVNFHVLNVGQTAMKPIDITNESDADAVYQVSLAQLFMFGNSLMCC